MKNASNVEAVGGANDRCARQLIRVVLLGPHLVDGNLSCAVANCCRAPDWAVMHITFRFSPLRSQRCLRFKSFTVGDRMDWTAHTSDEW
jgi:hypothetical protein